LEYLHSLLELHTSFPLFRNKLSSLNPNVTHTLLWSSRQSSLLWLLLCGCALSGNCGHACEIGGVNATEHATD